MVTGTGTLRLLVVVIFLKRKKNIYDKNSIEGIDQEKRKNMTNLMGFSPNSP